MEQVTSKLEKGFRFNPFDQELITDFLKPAIKDNQFSCDFMPFKQVYGPRSHPWIVFPEDDPCWFSSPQLQITEKCMYIFSTLSKVASKSKVSSKKSVSKKPRSCSGNTWKISGCGTWGGRTGRQPIRDANGDIIGEKRYLVFEINEINSGVPSDVGLFKMHEYTLSGLNAGLDSADSIVLCKITHDSAKPCPINLKSSTHNQNIEPHEIINENLVPINNVMAETKNKNLEATSIVLAENKNENLDATSNITAEAILGGVDDRYSFDALGDLGDLGPPVDADWITGIFDLDSQQGPVEDDSINNFGKRKFEAEENLCSNKKMCISCS